jgi:hypothetical protein
MSGTNYKIVASFDLTKPILKRPRTIDLCSNDSEDEGRQTPTNINQATTSTQNCRISTSHITSSAPRTRANPRQLSPQPGPSHQPDQTARPRTPPPSYESIFPGSNKNINRTADMIKREIMQLDTQYYYQRYQLIQELQRVESTNFNRNFS